MKTDLNEVINYLEKTSKHVFVNRDDESKIMKIVYDNENSKILVFNNPYCEGEPSKRIDIISIVNYYRINAKCVISHSLFLNKNFLSKRFPKKKK